MRIFRCRDGWESRFSAVLLAFGLLVGSSFAAPSFPFQDPQLPLDQRVADLISRLTLEEKAAQMMENAPAIPRLGIPAYVWWNEALHGVARAGVATVFPQAIGLAATWDTHQMKRVSTIISDEARAKHHESRLEYRAKV